MKVIDSFTMRPMSCALRRVDEVAGRLGPQPVVCGPGRCPHHLWERRARWSPGATIASLPATAAFTASAVEQVDAHRLRALRLQLRRRLLPPRDGPHLVARLDEPVHRRRTDHPGRSRHEHAHVTNSFLSPFRGSHIIAPTPASTARRPRATSPAHPHCADHQVGEGHGAQLGSPRLVGAVHHRVDRARHPVLTRRARGRAPAADLGAPERGLVARRSPPPPRAP